MTEIDLKLDLPDSVAREAKAAGLLSPRAVARLLREEIRLRAFRRIADGAERVRKAGVPPMSMDEIQRELDAVRKARRERA